MRRAVYLISCTLTCNWQTWAVGDQLLRSGALRYPVRKLEVPTLFASVNHLKGILRSS